MTACTTYGSGGVICKNNEQDDGQCEDYEVRFLCTEEYHGVGELEQALECAGQELAISCQGYNTIVIHEAFYGRSEEGLCSRHGNQSYDLNCALNSTQVLDMVKTNCDDKKSCKLNVQMSAFNAICPDVPLYLDIVYDCQDDRDNHAEAKPSNQSSIAGNHDASFGNDGMTDKNDCLDECSITELEWEPWYVVDLERPYLINAVSLFACSSSYRENMTNFEIHVGNSENFEENELCGNLTEDVAGTNEIYCGKEITGRYVSVHAVNVFAELFVCELQAFFMGHKQKTATSCDGQIMQLSCDNNVYIEIDDVFYGREDDQGLICPHRFSNHTYSQCDTDDTAKNVVVSKCVGNRECEIDVKKDIWDVLDANNADSCPNAYKYLQVSYSCHQYIEGNSTGDTRAMACENQNLKIACSGANRFIEITSASWGAASETTPHWCANEPEQPAYTDVDVTADVSLTCDNKRTCQMKARDFTFHLGDTDLRTTQRMYLDVNFTCKDEMPEGEITMFACDGYDKELSLTCPDGLWINITDAFYGRTRSRENAAVCRGQNSRHHSDTDCRSNDTRAIVERYCQGQRSCSLPVDEASLTSTDPCEDLKQKYLEVSYTCQEIRPLGDLTLYACGDHDDLSVECPASHPHVRIITADFGRQEDHMRCANRDGTFAYAQHSECYTPNVLSSVRSMCTNMRNCTVPSYWAYYSNKEPCRGVTKYLEVTYRCLMDIHDWTPCGEYAYFINPRPDLKEYGLHGNHALNTAWTRNILECQKVCMANDDCASFHFETVKQSNGYLCTLNNMIYDEVPNDYVSTADTLYFQRESYREFD